ncbi:MAG: hypothetical protein O3C21_18750 [Verrucomicrobia bacterium]|nr:hypothetical protein [Verrucomicrobiota bacterium]
MKIKDIDGNILWLGLAQREKKASKTVVDDDRLPLASRHDPLHFNP